MWVLCVLLLVISSTSILPVNCQTSVNAEAEEICSNSDACHSDVLDQESADDDLSHCHEINKPLLISRTLDLGNNMSAWVIDSSLQSCATQLRFKSLEAEEIARGYSFNHVNYTKKANRSSWSFGKTPWSHSINLEKLLDVPSWKKLTNLVEKLLQKKVIIQRGEIELLRSMDSMPPVIKKNCSTDQYVLTVFFNKMWNLNNYGQVSFYAISNDDNGNERWEIIETVHPHPYRAILWPSCQPILFRAPCVNYRYLLKYANFYLSTNEEFSSPNSPADLPLSGDQFAKFRFSTPLREVEFERHLVRKFDDGDPRRNSTRRGHVNYIFVGKSFEAKRDKDKFKNLWFKCSFTFFGISNYQEDLFDLANLYLICEEFSETGFKTLRQVHIFDGLFTDDQLREWRSHILRIRPSYQQFDPAPLEDHDNVQWVSMFEVDAVMRTEIWTRLQALCEFVSNHSGWHAYDVALNYVRSADHTRIHPDSSVHHDELTMVLYLNEDLTPSDFGETTFYVVKPDDGVHQFTGEGGEVYEAIGAVAPKFGRVAIFTNNIEHSAHPPSTKFLGSRYTFALKACKSKRLALIKRIYETMEGVELDERLDEIRAKLESGYYDQREEEMPTALLEKLLGQVKSMVKV